MLSRSKRYSLIAAGVLLTVSAAGCGDDDDGAADTTASDGTTAVSAGSDATAGSTAASAAASTAPAGSTAGSAADSTASSAAGSVAGSTATGGSAPEGMSIVYVPGLTGNPFYNTVACGAENRAEELGIEFTYQGAPEFDVAKQSAIVSALIGEEPDAIMISVTDPDAMIPPLQEAKDAGIDVIGIDGDLSDTSILATNIQSDNLIGGALAARSLVEAVGEDVGGDVLPISSTPGAPITDQRLEGFADELAKYPAFTLLETQYANNQQSEAATFVSTTASSNDNLVGVYTMTTNNTEGAITGLREADKTPEDVKIVGYDVSEPILQALADGNITGLVVQNPYGAGQRGVDTAVALANGEEVERNQATDFVFATPENLDTPEVQQFIYKLECG